MIDTALFAPLPFRDEDRLVTLLRGSFRSQPPVASMTPADFVDFRTRAQSFESLAAAMPATGRVNFTGSGEPEQIRGFLVTANFFQTLGVTPLLGPGLNARDDQVSRGEARGQNRPGALAPRGVARPILGRCDPKCGRRLAFCA